MVGAAAERFDDAHVRLLSLDVRTTEVPRSLARWHICCASELVPSDEPADTSLPSELSLDVNSSESKILEGRLDRTCRALAWHSRGLLRLALYTSAKVPVTGFAYVVEDGDLAICHCRGGPDGRPESTKALVSTGQAVLNRR